MKDHKLSEDFYRGGYKVDGWDYSPDGTQRSRKRSDGYVTVESVPIGETLTQQQFDDDCNVNKIMPKLLKTGGVPKFTSATGVFGDFTEIGDFRQAVETQMRATEAFMELPAELRLKFENDPGQLINYLQDERNIEESIKLGLRNAPETPRADMVVEELKGLRDDIRSTSKRKSKEDDGE